MTGEQWVCLEAVLPPLPVMGRKPRDRRQVFDGIWWRARTGSPWRDLPERYGPWETAYSARREDQPQGACGRPGSKESGCAAGTAPPSPTQQRPRRRT
nr:transposase [Streptomyces sp. AC512_CC834]